MDNNIKVKKNYEIPFDIFRKGYIAYQKKYVYPKSYMFMCIFLLFSAVFVYWIIKDGTNDKYGILNYLAVIFWLALAFREWYNPRKMRRSVFDAFKETEGTEYAFAVTDKAVEIATVINGEYNSDDNTPENEYHDEEIPEASVLPIDEKLEISEYDDFFIVMYGKSVFYIVPKEKFSDEELEIVRNIEKN